MNMNELAKLLEDIKQNKIAISDAMETIKSMPYEDLQYAKVDHHRELRNGHTEIIYSPGKSLEHIKGIISSLLERSSANIMASRSSKEVYDAISEVTNQAVYYELARTVVVEREEYKTTKGYILIMTAGTADIAVAEEAAITATFLGNRVERLYDVGVAGIHRLLDNLELINQANAIIVVAGMEGALASVVGGLTDKPLIAVPTSIGYGANFGGVSALLGMLTSCASGIGVVNIDNGFGAASMASKINKQIENA